MKTKKGSLMPTVTFSAINKMDLALSQIDTQIWFCDIRKKN